MNIIPGNASPILSSRIAEKTGGRLIEVEYRRFPDGELYVRVKEVPNECVVVQSINSNDDLVYLILILDALENSDVTLVVPYMGYARQDKRFLDGEAVSIRAVAKILESYAERIYTVNIHSKDAESWFRKLENLDAMPLIGERYKDKDVVMIAPDKGSLERVKVAAKYAGCDYDYLEKKRVDAETVEIFPKNLEVEGRDVVIIDDIVSTGGTIVEAVKSLEVKSVEVACVHAVLAGNALNRIYSAGVRKLMATDTVEKAVSEITVSPLISEVLQC
ncbi:ribose-phosphate diphosphokinase [Ferroglobus sp.]|uniref:ribose-phosphate diphosphokinase n=1 Tax=Ferroglobus sp. TaxID=2614230 RepID=UPI0025BDA0CB|nr:ribose-phosphate diphosphokinase [Ferroglobus sp.]